MPLHHFLNYIGLFFVLTMRIIATAITTVEPMETMSVNSGRPIGYVVLEVVVVVVVVLVVMIVDSAVTVTMTESEAVYPNTSNISKVKLYSPTARPSTL